MTPKNSLEELQSIVAHMNKRLNIVENRLTELHTQYYKEKAQEFKDELQSNNEWSDQ